MLQKLRQQLQPVALLHLRHERLHREEAPHRQNQILDEVLLALRVQKGAHHLRGVGRVHLLAVALDVAQHVVGVQVRGQVLDEAEPVAHVDERARVGQLGLHEKHLDALGVVLVAFACDALHLLDLARLGRRLDVFGVHLGVLAEGKVRAEVEVEALVALERLHELDDGGRSELLGVLLRNLDDELKVLTDVAGQQLLEAVDGPLPREGAEELDQRLRLDSVGVHHDALDIGQVSVVPESARVQASLLAQLGDLWPVVVGEHAVG
eukprot:1163391-Prorocentrum_minimum.AAC.6